MGMCYFEKLDFVWSDDVGTVVMPNGDDVATLFVFYQTDNLRVHDATALTSILLFRIDSNSCLTDSGGG